MKYLIFPLALQNSSNNSSNGKEDGCPFYRCPGNQTMLKLPLCETLYSNDILYPSNFSPFILEKAFAGFIKFFEDFNTPCFNKGMTLGVTIGLIGTVLISAVIYSVIR